MDLLHPAENVKVVDQKYEVKDLRCRVKNQPHHPRYQIQSENP